MTEIEKMFENVGIKPTHYDACKIADAYWQNEELASEYGTFDNYMKLNCPYKYQECTDECKHAFDRDTYPPFTAEKQLELIKWLAKIYELSINWEEQHYSYRFVIRNYKNGRLNHSVCGCEVPFEETLAYLINRIWQSLTDQEKEEIRNILNA